MGYEASGGRIIGETIANGGFSSSVKAKTERLALELLSKSQEPFSSAKPTTIAASALYAACVIECDHLSQADIARGAGISNVTIRKHYPRFLEQWKKEKLGARIK